MHPTRNSAALKLNGSIGRVMQGVRSARRRCKNNRFNSFAPEVETLTGLNP